jgi:Tfp pilus assembly protein PilX
MRLIRERLRPVAGQGGFTMIAVLGAILIVTMLVTAALAATNGDQKLIQLDMQQKRAYAAAQAGIADYTYHLNNDNGYWARCTSVPSPNAVNLQGSTANRRAVPGSTDGSAYAIELIPATGQSACSSSNPTGTMLESNGPNIGTFRIRSTGFSGNEKQSIIATYKQATFLDYVYFTQLETSDPVTYGFTNPSSNLDAAYAQCTKFRRDGRPRTNSTTPSSICDTIVFVGGDHIDGPMHTNDDFCINGSDTPSMGRNAADIVEVAASPPGYHSASSSGNGCTGGATKPSPGTFATNAPVLTPPATNTTLKAFAGPSYTYTGQTTITLSGTSMSINGGASVPIPSDGVVYVQNGTGCTTSYSPFNTTYPATSGCGTAIVQGNYSGQLTIAAENDVLISGNLIRSGSGLLGLVANNFVRIKHPCTNGTNGTGSMTNPQVDAAILAIDHSFIVDNYNCGAGLGSLQVNGAIAQKFRGAVGTVGASGYIKDYNYDDRLRYQEPPHFFDPVQSAWHVQRETLG